MARIPADLTKEVWQTQEKGNHSKSGVLGGRGTWEFSSAQEQAGHLWEGQAEQQKNTGDGTWKVTGS